ncbi:hypothetical protein C8Q79DRAFT_141756 [Trametes meyenii]|nr:hypothetical protein C8Q79DRAFT_141756 [Trametes meyenii]
MCCFCASDAHSDLDVLRRASAVLKTCQDTLQQCQVPGFPLVIHALNTIIEKVRMTRINDKAVEDLAEEISLLTGVIDEALSGVLQHIHPPTSPSEGSFPIPMVEQVITSSSPLSKRVSALQNHLEGLVHQADKLRRRHFISRYMHAHQDLGIVEELRQGIHKALTQFQLGNGITIEALVDNVRQRVREIEDAMKRAEEERLLELLPRAPAGFQATKQAAKARYLQGTFTDILDDLRAWAQGDTNMDRLCKPVWFLSGPAGSGKSTLAAKLCRDLDKLGILGASFFFDQAVGDLASPRYLFTTIAHQLASSIDKIRPPIAAAIRQNLPRGTDHQMRYEAERLLFGPLQTSLSKRPCPMVIVVDGLDECTTPDRAEEVLTSILQLLVECAQVEPSRLRILVTTRPSGSLDSAIHTSAHRDGIHTLSLLDRPQTASSDIATLLRSDSRIGLYLQQHPDAAHRLTVHAGSSFAYARAAIDFLKAHPAHIEERLGALLSSRPPRSSSFYALYPVVTNAEFDTHRWHNVRVRADRPTVFALCGNAACYQQVTEWLRSPATADVSRTGTVPSALLDGLCAGCRAVVQNEPLELWMLKKIVTWLRRRGLDYVTILPSNSPEGASHDDPWLPDMHLLAEIPMDHLVPEGHTGGAGAAQRDSPPLRGVFLDVAAELSSRVERVPSSQPYSVVSPAILPVASAYSHASSSHSYNPAPPSQASPPAMPAPTSSEHFVGGFVTPLAGAAMVVGLSVSTSSLPAAPALARSVYPEPNPVPPPPPIVSTLSKPSLRLNMPSALQKACSSPLPSAGPSAGFSLDGMKSFAVRPRSPTAAVLSSITACAKRASTPRTPLVLRSSPAILQMLVTPTRCKADPWGDLRRISSRVTAGSPVRPCAAAQQSGRRRRSPPWALHQGRRSLVVAEAPLMARCNTL